MSNEDDPTGTEIIEGAVINLHNLAKNLTVMQLMLDRKGIDGAAVIADPALIEASIRAGREEMRCVRTLLTEVLAHPANPLKQAMADLVKATAGVDDLLDALEGAVHRLER